MRIYVHLYKINNPYTSRAYLWGRRIYSTDNLEAHAQQIRVNLSRKISSTPLAVTHGRQKISLNRQQRIQEIAIYFVQYILCPVSPHSSFHTN